MFLAKEEQSVHLMSIRNARSVKVHFTKVGIRFLAADDDDDHSAFKSSLDFSLLDFSLACKNKRVA